ncbi:MAG: alpha-L-rhamnosidase C-terminal domain-containing protein [Ilumatobacteraceae bacterium]
MAELDFPGGRWSARWIWPHRSTDWDHETRRRTAAFRTSFDLHEVPPVVPARLAVVGRATWYVNGHEVGRGPVRVNPRRMRWDDADIAPFLRPGRNEIAVLATADVDATAWSMPLPDSVDLRTGALVFEVHLGDGRVVASDGTWFGTILPGWSATPSFSLLKRGDELVDLRSLPDGWLTGDLSTTWPLVREQRATVFGGSGRKVPPTYPVGPWAGRPTSRPVPTTIPLRETQPGEFVADRIVVGTVLVDVEGPAGAVVQLHGAERLHDGRPADEAYDSSVFVVLDGTRRVVESVDLFGVHGIRVSGTSSEVRVHAVSIVERLHPVTGDHTFHSSDPLLDRIVEVGRRTVSISSLDSYVDCPTREQRAWTGDSVVHQLVDLTTNDDWSLARWHPVLAASPRADGMIPMSVAGEIEHDDMSIVPDWALHWIHSVHNLYRYCGDRDEIRGLLAVVEGVLRWFDDRTDHTGLPVEMPGWVLVDWSAVHTDGANSTIAGLWGRALLEFAEMSDWLGDGGRAAWARARHGRLVEGFERFWDPSRRLYVDSVIGDQRLPMASQHAQASAIVGRLAPRERWSRLVEVVTDGEHLVHAAFARTDGPSDPGSETELGGAYLYTGHPEPWWDTERQIVRAQPFFRYVVHDALADAGRSELLPDMLLDWEDLLARCATSFGEVWYGGTRCHGWSSTPTRDVIQHVLGVVPAEPGFASVRIEPALGPLTWAEASCPTPRGRLSVRVDSEAVEVTTPVPATVVIEGVETVVQPGEHRIRGRGSDG